MLVEAIIEEFITYFEQQPGSDTILWFDPQSEWHGLLPYLESDLPLLVYDGSQLRLRHELAKRQAGQRAVVYLPMEQREARYLRPYFYTSKCHTSTMEKSLRDEGVNLPTDMAILRELRPLLRSLSIVSVGKGHTFWQGIVNLETALGRLIADFDDTLLRLLSDPHRSMIDLSRRELTEPFFKLVTIQFGVEPPEAGKEEPWADRFTALLCLVETYEVSEQAPGFPFDGVLPPPVHRDRCRNLLRKWQHHDLFKSAFRERAKSIDAQYPLGSWVAGLTRPPSSSAFLNVEKALWKTAQKDLDKLSSKAESVEFARERQEIFQNRAAGFWACEGEMPGWRVLAGMAETVIGAQEAVRDLETCTTATSMIERYATEWWKIDNSYRRFRTELDRGALHLDAAARWTNLIYHEYLETTNSRFSDLVTEEGTWPPAGQQVGAAAVWNQRSSDSGGLRALVMVDALRYELAQDLTRRLEIDPSNLTAGLSPVPSVTDLGMVALLPGWPEFRVDYDNDWIIAPPDGADNLAPKAKRLAWLVDHLRSVEVFDLDQWLSTPLDRLDQSAGWIVITSSEIDFVGEGAGTVILHACDPLLDRLEHGVRRLLAVGCTEVHVVTDHGFLLRESVREPEKVKVDVEGVLKKRDRYLIGKVLPPTDLPHLPVSGSHDLVAWFPRGIGCFATPGPYNYMHGGIALQEVVTPYIQVRQSVVERLVEVSLQLVDGPEIRNAIFKICLIPKSVDLLAKPRQVEIDILRHGERVSRAWRETVKQDAEERSLMLEPEYGLALGDQVQIRVRDAITGELLDEEPAVIHVALDL